MLSAIDKDRIEAAVHAAEAGTSGEIVCMLAQEVSAYREVPLAWAAATALVVPPLAVTLGLRPLAAIAQAGVWEAAQAGAFEEQFALGLLLYAAAQAALFIGVYLLTHIPAVRRRLTPGGLKRHRVARAAHHQFAAFSARAVGSATGVLIFVALDDRQVQILADGAIHDKVGDSVWASAAKAVGEAMKAGHDPTAGIIRAIEICGAALCEHFPSDGPHVQVFSDRPMDV